MRLHPSLQSEQIGVIPVEGTLTIIDELSNSDGVWVRLSQESLLEHCNPQYNEAWCLQYNQHYDKVLLKPITEPQGPAKPMENSFNKPQQNLQNQQQTSNMSSSSLFACDLNKPKKRSSSVKKSPGNYTVVKCGAR